MHYREAKNMIHGFMRARFTGAAARAEYEAICGFLRERLAIDVKAKASTPFERFLRNSIQHIALVASSLTAAILIAIPLGIAAARRPRLLA